MDQGDTIVRMTRWYSEKVNAYLEWFFGDALDVVRDLAGVAGLKAGMRVLDIGCNLGYMSFGIAREFGCYAVGVDASRAAIEAAQIRAQADPPPTPVVFHVADARDMPFEDGEFDAVLSKDTFVNIENKPALLAEVFRVLKPDGRFAFRDWMLGNPEPTQLFLDWRAARKDEPYDRISLEGYEALLRDAGFVVTARQDRGEELRQRFAKQYDIFAAADPAEAQRRFEVSDHERYVKRFGDTLEVLQAGDITWGEILAQKDNV